MPVSKKNNLEMALDYKMLSFTTARHPIPSGSVYNASKAALTSLAKTTALEEAPKGVRANIISPGPIMSEMTEGLLRGRK